MAQQPAEDSFGLEEIVVTARKVEENLMTGAAGDHRLLVGGHRSGRHEAAQ
jgi:hypothetical protein